MRRPDTGTGRNVLQDAPTINDLTIEGATIADATLVDPVVGTQSPGDNSTLAASTAYVDAAIAASSSSITAAFRVHKNGTDQTGVADSTPTLLTWSTEAFDVNNHFASNAWTPPAGKVILSLAVYITGTGTTAVAGYIYKNASPIIIGVNTTSPSVSITVSDNANGTDTYSAYGFIDVSSGTGDVEGDQQYTTFSGVRVGT
jgi:hypothetical protein